MNRLITLCGVAISAVGCGSMSAATDAGSTRAAAVAALTGDAPRGAALYSTNCSGCHGSMGKGPGIGGSLVAAFASDSQAKLATYVIEGIPSKNMPAFANLSDQQIADVLAHGKATFK